MRIGELAVASGTTTKTLRFYEEAGLLPAPERTANGYRDYTPAALARLDFVRRGRTAGLTLAQIREILDIRDAGVAPCQHVQDLLDARLGDLVPAGVPRVRVDFVGFPHTTTLHL